MTINQTSLHDLCVRAATGDDVAREDFNDYVSPLVEVVVRRWLHRQHDRLAPGVGRGAAYTSPRARQMADDVCARMIASGRQRSRPDARADETLVIQRGDDTLRWTAAGAEPSRRHHNT